MNNREIRFRESFRGYNRDDVKAYIEQLNIIFSKKEAELKATIEELNAKVNAVTEAPAVHTEEEWAELEARLEEVSAEVARLTEEKSVENSEEENLYDTMSAQVGSILISANENADKIIAEANEEASRIKSEAEIYASSVRAEADKRRDEILSGITDKVRDFAVECVSQYGTIIGETSVTLEGIADNLKSRSEILLSNLETKSKEIESKLLRHNED